MEKKYNPSAVEDKWYTIWTKENLFHADEQSPKPPYSIVIPPPNVTGVLHMGHALNNTLQDILTRYHRMTGCEALWLPGTDHAGIATQNVVERNLSQRGTNRHALGREAFIEEVWKWKHVHHATISNQLKKLGSSCDWDRERFTMDEGLCAAVRRVFVTLYKQGLIYKGKYIINWCPRCCTALSDEEAEHRQVNGKLYHFKYPYADGSGHVIVATTRPETMLGDTAVAVNPKDGRYTALVGKTLLLPLVNREIPLIADDFVDKEFGTGAVKVTPAHDPNDFAMGRRHAMEPVVVMDEAGSMTGPIPGHYVGMDRFACRKAVLQDMTAQGLVEKIEEHTHAVGHCYRCHTVVEPYYSDQWFVRMKPLAKEALAAAVEDRVKFFPQRWRKTYIDWMENIRDWCISRQIWWGHRIPVWYCGCGEVIVEEDPPDTCPRCGGKRLTQDNDVLDTWFSSWLWPFSTMGWPAESALMKKFYPTSVLITAPEILFFWVARMIMAGLHFTGRLPFRHVILHGTVRDKTGRKMSKSLGNAIDPLEIIAAWGADALRFSMIMITAQGADVFLAKDTFDIGRNFANKLWNASRFLLGTVEKRSAFSGLPPIQRRKAEDKWILSRLQSVIGSMRDAIAGYRFNEAAHTIYDFVWHEFCDWYIEAKKGDLYQQGEEQRKNDAIAVACHVHASILKLLHPFMPFITEEIWEALGQKVSFDTVLDARYIMNAVYPVADASLINGTLENDFSLIKEIVVALRTIRSENNVPPDKTGKAIIIPETEEQSLWIATQTELINRFVKLSDTVVDTAAQKPAFAGSAVVRGVQLFLLLEGLVDTTVERERLSKEIGKLEALIGSSKKKLESKAFISRAPEEVVAREKEKLDGLLRNHEKLHRSLEALP
ncbi:MAG: valine--tRNA ligase [Chitinispirillaceae bacterium]|nr:valine--tRNA ligase [Chitinispirillaceae bacterium]